MDLRRNSPNDPHGQDSEGSQNDLSYRAWDPMPAAQVLPSSPTTASQPGFSEFAAPGLNHPPSSGVAYDGVPNPWTQELSYRPATKKFPLSSQPGEGDDQRLQENWQYEGGTRILDFSRAEPEKDREQDGAAIFDSKDTPSTRSSPEDGRYATSPSQLRSNNPFLKARQNSGALPKQSIPGLDPFEFPQSSSLDGHQDDELVTRPHNPNGLDGELPKPSFHIPYEDDHNDLGAKPGPRGVGSHSPFLEKGKAPLVSGPPSIVIQPSDPYHQLDKVDHTDQNLPAPNSSQSSPSRNLINFGPENDPNESTRTDAPSMSSVFDDHPRDLSNKAPSISDELASSTSKPATAVAALEHVKPALSHLSESGQPPAILQKKLSETYDIRQVNWTDGTTSLRKSPVLVQNENGPCPLLALVNGLVLRSRVDSPSPITKALQSREKISLGLLMQALFDELTTYLDGATKLPDIEALSSFLVMLHTGMNVNPQLVMQNYTSDLPGTFLETNDTILYSSFKLPLVHGWLAEPSSAAYAALNRVAQNHEDIQLLHFRKEELENRVFRGHLLSIDEKKLIEDIDTIQHFVDVENATQLSAFGLEHLRKCLKPGSISILFRNDHFSTLFKHPLSNQLFTLVTDAGYSDHAEIVWESLVDVNGSNAGFFSGDFRPVGNSSPHAALPQHPSQNDLATSSGLVHRNIPDGSTGKQMNNTEQTDADYAFALALQFQDEEEQRRTNPRNQSQTQTSQLSTSQSQGVIHHSSNRPNFSHRPSVSSTGRRAPQQSQEVRSLVPPPRTSVADPSADAPPPTYEQAANSPVYTPSSDHSQYDGSQNSNASIAGPRSSSYGLNNVGPNRGPVYDGSRRAHALSNPSLPPRPRDRDRNKDCTVM
ncbi:endoglucanase [Blastomyces parvus]|uniref:Endoglucanase n=1 Tax=Blastomyces parvus TaxID=2060905 RepID=A0A2B7WQJ1_9EURO|nr:endoglucanase [Blastomyces parvus]